MDGRAGKRGQGDSSRNATQVWKHWVFSLAAGDFYHKSSGRKSVGEIWSWLSLFLPAITRDVVPVNTAFKFNNSLVPKCLNSPLFASVADFDESKSPSIEQLDALREFAGIAAGASGPESLATLAFLYMCLAISAKYG